MRIINIILTIIFVFLLVNLLHIKVFNTVYVNELSSRIILILMIILVFNIKTKTTWYAGLVLFVYGLLDMYYLNVESAEPAVFKFTSPYFNLFFAGRFDLVLYMIPTLFYLFSIIYFSSNAIRNIYLKGQV